MCGANDLTIPKNINEMSKNVIVEFIDSINDNSHANEVFISKIGIGLFVTFSFS